MWEQAGIVVGALVTLAIFSLLYKDNPLYRFAESLLVGVSAGYYLVQYCFSAIYRKFYIPVIGEGDLWLLPGGILGLLILLRLSRRVQWMSRYAIAFYVAAWSGYLIPSVLQERILIQIRSTFPPSLAEASIWAVLGSLFLLVGVVSILVYFFFSAEHRGALGRISQVGITFLMVGFGASFGYTVMGRVSLLIGRFQYLFQDLPQALSF